MLCLSRLVAVLVVLFACGSSDVLAQKKTTRVPASAADYGRLMDNKNVLGTLIAFDDMNDTMTVRIDMPHYEPNPNYRPANTQAKSNSQVSAQMRQIQQQQQQQWQQQQTLARLQSSVMRARTPQQRQQAMVNLARESARIQQRQAQNAARLQTQNLRNMSNVAKNAMSAAKNPNSYPYKVVTVSKVYELDVATNVVVRSLFLPTEFDDTGNYKTYTEREKADLRGNDSAKPGYRADADDLVPAQEIKLYLTPAKNSKQAIRPDDDVGESIRRPVVSMIVLTRENSSR